MSPAPKTTIRIVEYGNMSDKVLFFFVGFAAKHWLYRNTINQLMKAGYHVVVFDYDNSVVWSGKTKDFLQLGADVVKEVRKRVAGYKKQGVRTTSTTPITKINIWATPPAVSTICYGPKYI